MRGENLFYRRNNKSVNENGMNKQNTAVSSSMSSNDSVYVKRRTFSVYSIRGIRMKIENAISARTKNHLLIKYQIL